MKLLMVSPHLPHPSWGAGMRSYYLLKALARAHRVSLLALVGSGEGEHECALLAELTHTLRVVSRAPGAYKRWQQLTSTLRGRSYLLDSYVLPELQHELDAMLSGDAYDAVLFESVFMAGYRLPAAMPVIIDEHNIEYELLERTYQHEKGWSGSPGDLLRKGYNWWESHSLKPVELERCRRARVVLVTSERERLLLKRRLPESRIEVVPNGVDIDVFDAPPVGASSERSGTSEPTIIFTGTMNYYPNIDAVLSFARECWPLIRSRVKGASLAIVGKDPPAEVRGLAHSSAAITVTGTVPDVRPYLAEATMAIAPIRIGSGTRLKILEALAMRKAVVATSLGCEGLSVVSGKHLRVADSARAFAQAVVDLLQDAEQRRALGNAGREFVEAEYSWRRCGAMAVGALDVLENHLRRV